MLFTLPSPVGVTTVNDMEEKKKHKKRSKAGNYPWDEWFSGQRVDLRRGEHYLCRTYIMLQQIHTAARKHGVKLDVQVSDDELTITLTARKE